MRRIVLHVDRLVLKGVLPEQAEALVHELREQLEARLADPQTFDLLAARGSRERLRAPPLAPPAPEPGGLGRSAGEAVARSLLA